MDNLKYYNDSFAYDYEIFAPKSAESKATILEYPEDKRKVKNKASAKGILSLVKKLILSALVLSAVCGSLYLRAEISSLNSKINSVKKEITELESESTRLDVELGRKVSLSNLEEAAEALGMQKCEKSQVTYIKTNGVDTAQNSGGNITAEIE